MSGLSVTDITVPTLLDKLRRREWLVPQFQREFVWTVDNIADLVMSIIESRPIGMATLWEQGSSQEIDLDPIWIPDADGRRYFTQLESNPSKVFAVLDGRQRCTAIAMAFGGLRALAGKFRFSVRFFLDVHTEEPTNRVVYLKESEIRKRNLTTDAHCISEGLFPLASNLEGEDILPQWMRYLQALKSPTYYIDGKLPPPIELERRDHVLKEAFEGLVGTKLAVYVVPETYHLAEICEIFETLNTTGTKVSTVDLIHSWLYKETQKDLPKPFLLREWIDDLGEQDGAIGWAIVDDRPELIAQIVTACHIALEKKPDPRRIAGDNSKGITTVKARDLLATPTEHWKSIAHNEDLLARFLGDFQKVVAGGYFPYLACPYPVTAGIYVAIRWHAHFDQPEEWGRDDLDSLFRAFFWRNALSNRYDQGFLTKFGVDLEELKAILKTRQDFSLVNEWASSAHKRLDGYMLNPPAKDTLIDFLTDGRQGGALQKALTLPMVAASQKDLLDSELRLSYPSSGEVELHHIYPKAWCEVSKVGQLASILDKEKAGRNWVDSTANMMPLSRKSNNVWKMKPPELVLQERKVQFSLVKPILKPAFIDEEAFGYLLEGPKGVEKFWRRRADLMAQDLIDRMTVTL